MFSRRSLKQLFIITAAMAIIFPMVSFYIIFPAFDSLLTENMEDEAARVAQSLSSRIVSEDNELKDPALFSNEIERARKDFNIEKIKVFSANGEIIHSSNPDDIGKVNKRSYFYDIVAKGNTFTKRVKNGTRTLEDRVIHADVIETYIPIMKNGMFLGSFEIYYDITLKNMALNRVVFRSSLIVFFLLSLFVAAIVIVLFREEKSSLITPPEKLSTVYQSPFYLLFFMLLSTFTAEAVVMFFLSRIPPMPTLLEAMLDSTLLVMLIAPLFYFFLLRPLILNITMRARAEEELKNSHVRLEKLVQERTEELEETNQKLEEDIKMRESAELRLRDKMNQLEEFFNIAVGRELKLKKLEEEIKKMKSDLSREKR